MFVYLYDLTTLITLFIYYCFLINIIDGKKVKKKKPEKDKEESEKEKEKEKEPKKKAKSAPKKKKGTSLVAC